MWRLATITPLGSSMLPLGPFRMQPGEPARSPDCRMTVGIPSFLASVTEILDNNLSENAKEMGEYMKQELAKLPHVKEARGRGLLVGCEYDIPIAVEVKHGCLDRMALITAIGDSVNRMIPPLIVTKKQIDELMLIMRASIEDAAAKY